MHFTGGSDDAKDRLTKIDRTGPVNGGVTATYTYDKAGNRTNVAVTGAGASGMAAPTSLEAEMDPFEADGEPMSHVASDPSVSVPPGEDTNAAAADDWSTGSQSGQSSEN